MSNPEICGVCWGSHMCGLPPRHDGDHICSPEDEDGGCERVARSGLQGDFQWDFYQLDLLRYRGDFCDLCGPVDRAPHINAVLDHAMRAHPDRWAADYAADYADYLGDGQWRKR